VLGTRRCRTVARAAFTARTFSPSTLVVSIVSSAVPFVCLCLCFTFARPSAVVPPSSVLSLDFCFVSVEFCHSQKVEKNTLGFFNVTLL